MEVTRKQISGFYPRRFKLALQYFRPAFPLTIIQPVFLSWPLLATVLVVWYFFAPVKKQSIGRSFAGCLVLGHVVAGSGHAEGIPHGLRTIGVIPAVFIISAWMLDEFGALI